MRWQLYRRRPIINSARDKENVFDVTKRVVGTLRRAVVSLFGRGSDQQYGTILFFKEKRLSSPNGALLGCQQVGPSMCDVISAGFMAPWDG